MFLSCSVWLKIKNDWSVKFYDKLWYVIFKIVTVCKYKSYEIYNGVCGTLPLEYGSWQLEMAMYDVYDE